MTKGPLLDYRDLMLSGGLRSDPAQECAAEKLQLLYHRLLDYRLDQPRKWLFGKPEPAPQGLYIFGDVGRGKSMLMDLFFESAPVSSKRRVHFHEFMIETHDRIHRWRKMSPDERQSHAKRLGLRLGRDADDPIPPTAKAIAETATLLCFDEFQVTDVADAMLLGRLFTGLFDLGVVVVATSNRAPEELYKDGLNRQLFLPFIDLIKQKLDVLHLDGLIDYRLERLAGLKVYHTPLDFSASQAMDAAWRRLTDQASGDPKELEVQGRLVPVRQAAKGVARFSFNELCAQPLGAADYLAIAHAFHTLLIDDIPKMTKESRNEARRFVALIDTLYDKRVKLISSAESEPRHLYPQGDGAFEFQRTASRLIEMQSNEYFAAGHAV
jgi:cell division protein ZapE